MLSRSAPTIRNFPDKTVNEQSHFFLQCTPWLVWQRWIRNVICKGLSFNVMRYFKFRITHLHRFIELST